MERQENLCRWEGNPYNNIPHFWPQHCPLLIREAPKTCLGQTKEALHLPEIRKLSNLKYFFCGKQQLVNINKTEEASNQAKEISHFLNYLCQNVLYFTWNSQLTVSCITHVQQHIDIDMYPPHTHHSVGKVTQVKVTRGGGSQYSIGYKLKVTKVKSIRRGISQGNYRVTKSWLYLL